ncbi:MAG: RNase adapter RapZ [Thalassolituus oleivorans]|uniref:RNase adapter RapZ n=1 Tax=Thalassolituus oleivorans TaxID=187493 RepID=UPI001B4EAA51|nr:RNase adapter RapZ [Thalassolituus oleivorans]MBQ0728653.1 RNase adapter RapZ [Thalassolituus oleivorans]MBQ0779466.1 RNase adapter RapZ [Thalassolituus oleivorans]
MRLVVISGRSGSGKSSALHVLEDLGFYCIDNLPIGLLPALAEQANGNEKLTQIAVSVDARNLAHAVDRIELVLRDLPHDHYKLDVVYLDASEKVLLQRFSATRRKHPLTSKKISLAEAIEQEKELLDPLANMADLTLDTTHMSVHELRSLIRLRVADKRDGDMSILFESFGFKHGIPIDADYVFDVRHLPNPYWDESLRHHTGLEQPVQAFLSQYNDVKDMQQSISEFMQRWMPRFVDANRSYMTIAIGCTGGQHRSVYMAEQLTAEFQQYYPNVQVRHRELARLSESTGH